MALLVVLEYGQAGMVWVEPINGGTPLQIAGGQSFPQEMTADSMAAYWTAWLPGPGGQTVMKCALAGCNHQPQVIARKGEEGQALLVEPHVPPHHHTLALLAGQ